MKFSLILPTINVTTELELFLKSLEKQTYKNFELIVVDQNENDDVLNILKNFEKNFEIKYFKRKEKGLSINRNFALYHMTGDIVGFPDDDCEYNKDTLEKVANFFSENEDKKIYSCRTLEKGENYGTGTMLEYSTEINKNNVEETIKSITFFVNYSFEDIELFDENLGVGAYFGSGEESDYALKLLHKGFKGYYFHEDIIFHPAKKGNYDDLERAEKYALGYGALVKKEVIERKNYFYIKKIIIKLTRNIGGMIMTENKKYHFTVFNNRIKGFFKYKCKK